MIASRFTFLVPGSDSSPAILANYLTGAVDLLDSAEQSEIACRLELDRNGGAAAANGNTWDDYPAAQREALFERGYLVSSTAAEESLLAERYRDFLRDFETTPLQLLFAASYGCNFSCSYCFQESYKRGGRLRREVVDDLFAYILTQFAAERSQPYITLFGGEPLLDGDSHRDAILYFANRAAENGFPIAIVTNGYTLADYLPGLIESGVEIREIQVTLDGDQERHDQRRPLHGGGATFATIASGIDAALAAGLRINLRMIVDRANLDSLPALARFADQRGWLNHSTQRGGSGLFATSIGRNYELHTCQSTNDLFDRLTLYREYSRLADSEPILHDFHRPFLHGALALAESETLPPPLFTACPATTREWAFDLEGDIYPCTAGVGVKKFRLGSFLRSDNSGTSAPGLSERGAQIAATLASRDIYEIAKCQSCAWSPGCGGGCAVLAANQANSGDGVPDLLAPDCRPVPELLALGVRHYQLG